MDFSINICTAKNEIIQILSKIENLKQKYNLLENSIDTIPQENFENIILEIKETQNFLNILLNKYENTEFQKELKRKLNKRIKKRKKITQKYKDRRKRKIELLENIDKNLNTIREECNKTLANDKFLKENKKSLSNLKKKILITKKNIKNLKLNKNSQNQLEFDQQIEELKLLEENLIDYNKEKQKLEETLIFSSNSLEDQWRKVLFGNIKRDCNVIKQPELENFLEIRRIWDSYIVPSTSNYGTSIPSGWICPSKNPTKKWTEYIFENCP